jgi:pSer/pThr/pTyr-binding forkhead associated (FHA) protein
MAHLTLMLKGREVSRHALTQEARIGRDPSNDLVIDNVGVSRHHATIRAGQDSQFSVHDAGSQNGVFVNGKRVAERQLVDGDAIQIGKYTLEYSSTDRPLPKPLVAEKRQGMGSPRAQMPTFALDAEQLQQVLATSHPTAAVAVAHRPSEGAQDLPTDASTDNPESQPVAETAVAERELAMPELAIEIQDRQPLSPLLWVGLGLTALCLVAALVIL